MKKKITILLLVLTLLLAACEKIGIRGIAEGNVDAISINKPAYEPPIMGEWKVNNVYYLNNNSKNSKENKANLFISSKLIKINDDYIINPKISARYIDAQTYFTSKLITVPKELSLTDKKIVVYKVSNDLVTSYELLQLDDNKLAIIGLDNITSYSFLKNLSAEEIDTEYKKISETISGDEDKQKTNFGLAIGLRKKNQSTTKEPISYSYQTYYIRKDENQSKADVLAVKNIVIPKETGLWTISQRSVSSDGIFSTNYNIEVNPTFSDAKDKNNQIEDEIYRRIDYVNDDYIGFTKYNYLYNAVSENYEIHNLNSIAKKMPLGVATISGSAGYQTYITALKESYNNISRQNELTTQEITPQETNIGIRRTAMAWRFISSIDMPLDTSKGSRIFKDFYLDLVPIINIANNSNETISWREVTERVPLAVDASVSPDEKYIMIQSKNEIEIYPLYYSYIGVNPIVSIQNTNDLDVVMLKWSSIDNINEIYNEFNRLEKISIQVVN
ncbi:hypothetical protein ACQRBF_00825 [Peptoniphilaceae bacterium SGI.131]